jgi:hypothetical protein
MSGIFDLLRNWHGDGFAFYWILSTLGLAIVACLAPLLLGMFAGFFLFTEDNPGKDTSGSDSNIDLKTLSSVEPESELAGWDSGFTDVRLIKERGEPG